MKKNVIYKNTLRIAIFVIMTSCSSLNSGLSDRKIFFTHILENPDSLTSIVKKSQYFDTTFFVDKYLYDSDYIKNIENPNEILIRLLLSLKNSYYEFRVNREVIFSQNEREPDFKKGEDYSDVGRVVFSH